MRTEKLARNTPRKICECSAWIGKGVEGRPGVLQSPSSPRTILPCKNMDEGMMRGEVSYESITNKYYNGKKENVSGGREEVSNLLL